MMDKGQIKFATAKETPVRRPRGFAAMDEARRREISRMGGRAAHESGNAHEWDSNEARAAGRLGGRSRSSSSSQS